MKIKQKITDRMEQQICSKILDELTKGNQKGSFRIYVNASNANWTLYYENYIYLDVVFELQQSKSEEKYIRIMCEGTQKTKFGNHTSLYLLTSLYIEM